VMVNNSTISKKWQTPLTSNHWI